MDYPYVDPSTGDYHDQVSEAGYAIPPDEIHTNGLDAYNAETGGLFSFVGNAVKSVGHAIGSAASGVAKGVSSVANVVQKGVGAITNNPLWDIARTGVSFIPGVGTAVSAGMAGASAIGRGDSLKDIGLAAAKGAIPGGPAAQAAFDVALGLAKGQNVTDTILQAAKSQVPGGDLGKAAFDAATAIAKGKAFDSVALEAIRSAVPGGVAGKAAFDASIAKFKEAKGVAPSGATRAFGALGMMPNRVASAMMARPELMRAPAGAVARELNTSIDNVQKAFTAFMSKWSNAQPRIHWSDVGAADSLESWCEREAIPMTGSFDDAGMLEGGDTGNIFDSATTAMRSVMSRAPRLTVSKPYVQALYTHGHNGIRQGILAHGILARLHHQTGELDGAGGWIIKSGETPSGIAQKVVGTGSRWQELLAVNPKLKVVTVGSTTQIQPFNPGQRLTLPTSWLGTAAPAPQPTSAPPGAAPIGGAQPTIQQGSTGASVMAWQNLLLKLGSKLVGTADGIFGPQTKAATIAYQNARGMAPGDGIVGPLTWGRALGEAAAQGGGPPPVVIPPPIVSMPPGLPPIVLPPSLPPVVLPPGLPPVVVLPPPGAPAGTPPVIVGPAVPTNSTDVAIGAVETSLAYFFQMHPDATFLASSPAYGLDPADHSGTWDPRDKTAMLGFQTWANKNPQIIGFPLPVTGEPDTLSVKALQAVTAADLSKASGKNIPPPSVPTGTTGTPPVTKAGSDDGLLLLGLAGAALVVLGGSGKRAA